MRVRSHFCRRFRRSASLRSVPCQNPITRTTSRGRVVSKIGPGPMARSYWITSLAITSSACRIVRPSDFAVFRLTVNSNCVGTSIDRSTESPTLRSFLKSRPCASCPRAVPSMRSAQREGQPIRSPLTHGASWALLIQGPQLGTSYREGPLVHESRLAGDGRNGSFASQRRRHGKR